MHQTEHENHEEVAYGEKELSGGLLPQANREFAPDKGLPEEGYSSEWDASALDIFSLARGLLSLLATSDGCSPTEKTVRRLKNVENDIEARDSGDSVPDEERIVVLPLSGGRERREDEDNRAGQKRQQRKDRIR